MFVLFFFAAVSHARLFDDLKKYAPLYDDDDDRVEEWTRTLLSFGIEHEYNLFSLDLQTQDELLAKIDDFVLRAVIRKMKRNPENKKYHYLHGIEYADSTKKCENHGWKTPFHQYFDAYKNAAVPLADKWEVYFAAYDKHFSRFRNKNVTFLEIGVQSGGSMLMWRWYFGPGLRYIGIDINDQTKKFASSWSEIVIGDAGSADFWRQFKRTHENLRFDILLDDGGHTMNQQITTFNEMYDSVDADGGLYVCEDLHTSYSRSYGGSADVLQLARGAGETTVFMDVIKHMVDYINGHRTTPFQEFQQQCARHAECARISKSLYSMHVYDSIFFAQKGAWSMEVCKAGTLEIPYQSIQWDGEAAPIDKYVALQAAVPCTN